MSEKSITIIKIIFYCENGLLLELMICTTGEYCCEMSALSDFSGITLSFNSKQLEELPCRSEEALCAHMWIHASL